MNKSSSLAKGMILVILGAALQNIIWYFRLSNPELMREFTLYFKRDGAATFLQFNVFNYFFLGLVAITYMIFYFRARSKKRHDVLGRKTR